jgi:glucose-6-phosphate isomerase
VSNALVRFEVVGDLYYRRFHRLRPGKDEAAATGRDSNDEENRAQFDEWAAMQLFKDALDRIAELEERVRSYEETP